MLKESSSEQSILTTVGKSFKEVRIDFEKQFFQQQLTDNHWNISLIAKKLGMQQPNLSRKIKELGLTK